MTAGADARLPEGPGSAAYDQVDMVIRIAGAVIGMRDYVYLS